MDAGVGVLVSGGRLGFLDGGVVVFIAVHLVALVVNQRRVVANDLAAVAGMFNCLGEDRQAVGGAQLALADKTSATLEFAAAVGAVVNVGIRVGVCRREEVGNVLAVLSLGLSLK